MVYLSELELLPRSPLRRTIVDYFILRREVFTEVVDCRIYHDMIKTPNSFGIGSVHKLMSLTLALPYDDSKNKREPALNRSRSAPKAPRTRFMAEKLKDVSTDVASRDEFQQELERRSPETLKKVIQLKDQYISLSLSTQIIIDRSQALVVDMIQEVATHVLSSSNPVQPTNGVTIPHSAKNPCDRRSNGRRIQ
jgi:hypothetical protein